MQEIIAKREVDSESREIPVNVWIPEDLWRRARAMAALSGVHVKHFLAEALQRHIEANTKEQ